LPIWPAALVEVTGVTTIVIKNGSGRARGLEGLDEEMAVLHGRGRTGRSRCR
jgi:23S rRNA (cytosine1962-C5)-methyltransferase